MNNKEHEESRVEIALHEFVFDGYESHFKLASEYAKNPELIALHMNIQREKEKRTLKVLR